MSSINYLALSPSPPTSNEKKKLETIFVAQHSSCFQKELNLQYNLKDFNDSPRKMKILKNKNSNNNDENLSYRPQESRNKQLGYLKDTFQRAHIFQESPLSIKHLDSLNESNKMNIISKSINNESSQNLKAHYKDIFKANSVEISARYESKNIHFNLNNQSLQYQEENTKKRRQRNDKNQTQDQDFFFTTTSIDYGQDEINQQNRRRRNYGNDIYRISQIGSIQRNNNHSINTSLSRGENKKSNESITKKGTTRIESYQTRQSKKLLKLPKLQNNLSKSLLQSYKSCQNSMKELGCIERSISQESIYQYDLSIPENQKRLVNQKTNWENRVVEYINEKKYYNFQDKQRFQIFQEGIDKRIHRYYIDEEQKRKNLLIQKMQKALQENQKLSFINEQRRDHFKEESFQQKYGIPSKSQKGNKITQNEEPHYHLYSPEINKKNISITSRRVSPIHTNNQSRNSTQISQQNSRKQSQISYVELLQNEAEDSLNEMLSNRLSSISYQRRKIDSKQDKNNDNMIKINQKIPNLNKINYPLQEFLQIKKQDILDSPVRDGSSANKSKILKEEFVDLNSPLSYQKNRKQQL